VIVRGIEVRKAVNLRLLAAGGKGILGRVSPDHHLACISKMLHVAADEWSVIANAPRMQKLDAAPADWDFLLPADSARLLRAAKAYSHEDYTLVLTVLRTGLRVTELLALSWDHVDLVAGTLRVRRSSSDGKMEQGPKTKRERAIELSPELVDALRRHRHLRGRHVFCRVGGKPLTRDMANASLARAVRNAGIRHVSWRVLRHTFASQLLMAGRSLKEVQELLGHTDVKTTLRYAHLAPTARRDAVASLDRLGHQLGTNSGVGAKEGSGTSS
jgi:integrase